MTKEEAKELIENIFGKEAGESHDIVDFYLRVNQVAIEEQVKQEAILFCEWMQRYALYDYHKQPYKYAARQQPNSRVKPETWTAEQLYSLYLKELK